MANHQPADIRRTRARLVKASWRCACFAMLATGLHWTILDLGPSPAGSAYAQEQDEQAGTEAEPSAAGTDDGDAGDAPAASDDAAETGTETDNVGSESIAGDNAAETSGGDTGQDAGGDQDAETDQGDKTDDSNGGVGAGSRDSAGEDTATDEASDSAGNPAEGGSNPDPGSDGEAGAQNGEPGTVGAGGGGADGGVETGDGLQTGDDAAGGTNEEAPDVSAGDADPEAAVGATEGDPAAPDGGTIAEDAAVEDPAAEDAAAVGAAVGTAVREPVEGAAAEGAPAVEEARGPNRFSDLVDDLIAGAIVDPALTDASSPAEAPALVDVPIETDTGGTRGFSHRLGEVAVELDDEATEALLSQGWTAPAGDAFASQNERTETLVGIARELGVDPQVGALQATFGTPQEHGLVELMEQWQAARQAGTPEAEALEAEVAARLSAVSPGGQPVKGWELVDLDVNGDGVVNGEDLTLAEQGFGPGDVPP